MVQISFIFTIVATLAALAMAGVTSNSYILSLDADTPASVRDEIVEALKSNGAKIGTVTDYPGIMQAIAYEDTQASELGKGAVSAQSEQVRMEAWKSSLSSFGDKVYALERDQVVTIQDQGQRPGGDL